jgi:trehalose-phosphatase
VHHGKKIVEVSAAQISKGAAVAWMLEQTKEHPLVVCAGDDQTDESMFNSDIPRLLSVKVGDGVTRAQYRVANPAALRRFLYQE